MSHGTEKSVVQELAENDGYSGIVESLDCLRSRLVEMLGRMFAALDWDQSDAVERPVVGVVEILVEEHFVDGLAVESPVGDVVEIPAVGRSVGGLVVGRPVGGVVGIAEIEMDELGVAEIEMDELGVAETVMDELGVAEIVMDDLELEVAETVGSLAGMLDFGLEMLEIGQRVEVMADVV